MNEWQLIETAPKDGTRLLLCSASYTSDWYEMRVCWWGENFMGRMDWIYCDDVYNDAEQTLDNVTHWMPLPEPPI